MTHLGQRLSALIDGELECDERERVLGHLARCGWCRDEAAALRTLKRRMNALGEAAAGAALTGRLMGLGHQTSADTWASTAASWPHAATAGGRAARYFLAGSVAVFVASLGTAAFIAGGDPQAQAPTPRVTPSVDVFLLEHYNMNGVDLRKSAPPWAPASTESPASRQP